MATQKLNLTRDQLATFLKNFEQIKQFEQLFSLADSIAPDVVNEVKTEAGNALATANSALAQLTRIANALEMLATAPVIENNNSVVTDYIDLPEIGPHVSKERRVQWNRDDGTMDVGLYGGSVLQVGQEIHYYAKNTSGATIVNGSPVMFTGTVGASGKLTFGLAVADGSVPSEYMMGAVTQDVANNAFGYITSFGLVRGFNTTGAPVGEVWADGDLLYFDPATPGTWTKFKPTAPNLTVPVAVVVNAASGGAGSIFMRMELNESLAGLQDVNVASVANNHTLVYKLANNRWENRAPVDAREDLGLGTGTPTNGQILIGNGTKFLTASITAGANIAITPGAGSITIAVTGLGTMAFENVGVSGTFTTADIPPLTVTVVNGIITSIV